MCSVSCKWKNERLSCMSWIWFIEFWVATQFSLDLIRLVVRAFISARLPFIGISWMEETPAIPRRSSSSIQRSRPQLDIVLACLASCSHVFKHFWISRLMNGINRLIDDINRLLMIYPVKCIFCELFAFFVFAGIAGKWMVLINRLMAIS